MNRKNTYRIIAINVGLSALVHFLLVVPIALLSTRTTTRIVGSAQSSEVYLDFAPVVPEAFEPKTEKPPATEMITEVAVQVPKSKPVTEPELAKSDTIPKEFAAAQESDLITSIDAGVDGPSDAQVSVEPPDAGAVVNDAAMLLFDADGITGATGGGTIL